MLLAELGLTGFGWAIVVLVMIAAVLVVWLMCRSLGASGLLPIENELEGIRRDQAKAAEAPPEYHTAPAEAPEPEPVRHEPAYEQPTHDYGSDSGGGGYDSGDSGGDSGGGDD